MKKESNKLVISNLDSTNSMLIYGVSDLYAKVFAGPPWNETTKCSTSGSYYGPESQAGLPCPDCSIPLSEAYPQAETASYILSELGKANPIGLLAFINNELAGFSWGYQTTPDKLVESKWKTPKMKLKVKNLLAEYGVTDQLFFGSETGVDPKFRGKNVGKELVESRLRRILRTGENYVLVRTNIDSPMYGICKYTAGFEQILGPVADKPLFSKKWGKKYKYVNAIDEENVDRVLFLYNDRAKKAAEYYDFPNPGWYGSH